MEAVSERVSEKLCNCCGRYFDMAASEILKRNPDKKTLVTCVEEILDGLNLVLFFEHPTDFMHESADTCYCEQFIKQHLNWVIIFESDVQSVIKLTVDTDESCCWFNRMCDKYKLLRHICLRNLH